MTSRTCLPVLLSTLLFHCAEPVPCTPPPVTDAGPTAPDLLVVMGTAVTVEATSPLASCISDQRSARVNLIGPDNLPRERAPTLALHPGVGGQLEAAVTFTPDEAGAWTVEVAFEPSLGTSRHQVWVATPRAASGAPPLARFTVPGTCVDAPWPVSASRIACELESGDIVLIDTEGGTSRFRASSSLWLTRQPQCCGRSTMARSSSATAKGR